MALILSRFESETQAAQALAVAVARDLHAALAQRARALLLVSGGRSPLPFFAALATQPLPWNQIDVSLVDERSVPFSHVDSNARFVCRHLLTGAAAAARWIPLMAPTPDWAAQDALARARAAAAAASRNPDLAVPAAVVLGLGSDGHTASLFVDAPQWREACTTGARYVAIEPGKAPYPRVSLSLSALISQRICYAWSNGHAKLETINHAKAAADAAVPARVGQAALEEAGPLALLIAHPKVTLHVFHHND
ncbi:MAG TPA: 6-phosphogluconolactonase [Burkholderiaceae bacterium]|jgi:6-phosphogluconolactonase|nr:6-phosphogluconolactonase [Burkholderiaceae bacterium]